MHLIASVCLPLLGAAFSRFPTFCFSLLASLLWSVTSYLHAQKHYPHTHTALGSLYLDLGTSLSLLSFLLLSLLQLLVLLLYQGDQGVAASLELQCCPRLDEPVKPELGSIANSHTDLIIHIVLVKTKLVEHANLFNNGKGSHTQNRDHKKCLTRNLSSSSV